MSSARRPVAARCGDSGRAATAAGGGGRARRLDPRFAVLVAGLAVATIAGAAALLLTGGSGAAPSRRHGQAGAAAQPRYGGLPSWLPKPKVRVGRVLHASAAHPALSIQGEAVSVALASGRVLATAVGPEVPEEGRFPVPPVTPTTFIVTFSAPSHVLPLSASAFELIDERGNVHRPKLTAVGGGTPPAQITPGRPVSVMLHDILPTGDGGLSWTPEGNRPIVTWDYTVEID